MVHLLGFCGSALIVSSVTMKSIARLRVIGLAGSLMFVAYGTALGAWPVVVTNVVTTSIHLYRLRGLAVSRPHVRRRRRSVSRIRSRRPNQFL